MTNAVENIGDQISVGGVRSRFVLFLFLFSLALFFLNFLLVRSYYNGDLYYYRDFYSSIVGVRLWEVPSVQLSKTGSGEPIYGILVWVSSHLGISHDVFAAALNTVLLAQLFILMHRYQAHPAFMALVFTNYYLLVLLTGAERLKVAFIVMAGAALAAGMLRLVLASLTPIAHIQMSAHVAAVAAAQIPRLRLTSSVSARAIAVSILAMVALVPLLAVGLSAYGPTIYAKLLYYSAGGAPLEALVKLSALTLIGLVVLPRSVPFLCAMLVFLACTYVVGSDRFQISALALLGYHAMQQKRTAHPLILLLMAYFSYKSIGFMMSVFEYGHGFGHVVESVVNR